MPSLTPGVQAPQFTSTDQSGKTVRLEEFLGKKIILYFYPKDDTPGCTAEACSLRDHYAILSDKGYMVLGVSPDDQASHQKFASKYDLPFTILSDTNHAIATAYGVWVEKNMYGKKYMGVARETFIVDELGIIRHIIKKVDTKNSSAQIMELAG